MYQRGIQCLVVAVAIAGMARAESSGSVASTPNAKSCCFVIATDVSGSMRYNDPLVTDAEGKLQALRDDAQLTFLTLLEKLHTRHYVGICKFSEEVTYGLPGGASKLVVQSKAMLDWQQAGLDWRKLREQIDTTNDKTNLGTRVDQAMDWALQRILTARRHYRDDSPGALVLLSDGDPDHALEELSAPSGRVLSAAEKLAAANIRVYPILINVASYRPGQTATALDAKSRAGENLLEAVAARTNGKAYRITPTFGLLDIFLEILKLSVPADVPDPVPVEPATGGFAVSQHHRTAILIGPALDAVQIRPLDSAGSAEPVRLLIAEGLDGTSGVERKVIPLARWTITILRRPEDSGRLRRFWSGTWRPVVKGTSAAYSGRVYLITDFLLDMTIQPASPCWAFEAVQVHARLQDRPKDLGEREFDIPPLTGRDLSLELSVVSREGGRQLPVAVGQWDSSKLAYTSAPFCLNRPGQYEMVCRCVDRVGEVPVLLGLFSQSFDVQPCPLRLALRKDGDGQEVLTIPAGTLQEVSGMNAGDKLRAEVGVVTGNFAPNALSGVLRLERYAPEQWPLKRQGAGRLMSEPFTLRDGDNQLAGRAEVRVETARGVRLIRLPDADDFHLSYHAPLRLACRFSERRPALWRNELHQQTILVALSPVFEDAAGKINEWLPASLPDASMDVLETFSQRHRTIPVRCTRQGPPQRTGEGGREVVATYLLESEVPLPSADSCTIDLGVVGAGLKAQTMQYQVVDPVAQGLFRWSMNQSTTDPLGPGVASEIFTNEEVQFTAAWGAGQPVAAVDLEILPFDAPRAGNGLRVNLPVQGPDRESRTASIMSQLQAEKAHAVTVRVALREGGTGARTNIRLAGGSFVAKPYRPLELGGLVVGAATGEDIPVHALEEVRIPLSAVFHGYASSNPQHSQALEAFKKSCVLTISDESGQRQEHISGSIEWTRAQVVASKGGQTGVCRLTGQALYVATRVGKLQAELSAAWAGSGNSPRAHARLLVKKPRFVCYVEQLTDRGGANALYDSDRLVNGEDAVFSGGNPSATQLRVRITFEDGVLSLEDGSYELEAMIEHRSAAGGLLRQIPVEQLVFTSQKRSMSSQPCSLTDPGRYLVRIRAMDGNPRHPQIDLRTRELVQIGDVPITALISPPGFLTRYVRQWPFKYRIQIPMGWPPVDNLQFQFQFAGMQEWLAGVLTKDEDRQCLIVANPDCLELPTASTGGHVRFRIRYMEADKLNWQSEGAVPTVEPRLTGMDFTIESKDRRLKSQDAVLTVNASDQVMVRPVFRAAPELEGSWRKEEVKIYVCRNSDHIPKGPITAAFIRDLEKRAALPMQPDRDLDVRTLGESDELLGARILENASRPASFWNWLWADQKDVYAVLASARYRCRLPAESDGIGLASGSAPATIVEWCEPYRVEVTPQFGPPPLFWILAVSAAFVAYVGVINGVRIAAVPRLERLGLEVRLMSEAAAMEPTLPGTLIADLRPTSVRDEFCMHWEYIHSRLGTTGRGIVNGLTNLLRLKPVLGRALSAPLGWLGDAIPLLYAGLRVGAGRLLLPRRRAWIAIRLRPKQGAQDTRMGLVCIWTGLLKRGGSLQSNDQRTVELSRNGPLETSVQLAVTISGVPHFVPAKLRITRKMQVKRKK